MEYRSKVIDLTNACYGRSQQLVIIIIIIMKAKIIVKHYIKNVTGALYTVNYNGNTLSVSVSVNAAWNSVVLTDRRNDCSEVAALTDEGRAFQARAAATGKARSPSVERRVDGTISVDVAADRRRRTSGVSQRGTVVQYLLISVFNWAIKEAC